MRIILGLTALAVLFGAVVIQAQDSCRMHGSAKSAEDSGWTELHAGMEKMQAARATLESSGNNDVDFVKLMLPHHQAAIDMAKVELKFGADPQMRRIAQEMITDQQSEMDLMQLWLKRQDAQESQPTSSAAKEH